MTRWGSGYEKDWKICQVCYTRRPINALKPHTNGNFNCQDLTWCERQRKAIKKKMNGLHK